MDVHIGPSPNGEEICILRNGFVVADPAMQQSKHVWSSSSRPLPQALGLGVCELVYCRSWNPEWRRFFEDLLQQDRLWAFSSRS